VILRCSHQGVPHCRSRLPSSASLELQMLAARAKERCLITSKMAADGTVAAAPATKISAFPASRTAVEILQSFPPV
jgi:hypothetical protein